MKARSLTIILLLLTTIALLASAFVPNGNIHWTACPEITPQSSSSQRSLIMSQPHMEADSKQKVINDLTNLRKRAKKFTSVNNVPLAKRNIKVSNISAVVECTLVRVPLLWDNSSSGNITLDFFVKRWRIEGRAPKGQLWLLQGGPGDPGTVFDTVGTAYQEYLNSEYDIYAPDYRGTGRSSYLHCTDGSLESLQQSKVTDCDRQIKSSYGPYGLYAFGATEASYDVEYVARTSKQSSSELIAVYGVSYGTYWLNRILTLFPNFVDTAVFDSVVRPGIDVVNRDDQFNYAGQRYINVCNESKECNVRFQSEFNEDVVTVMTKLFAKQGTKNACMGSTYTPVVLSQLFATVLADRNYRKLVFPTVYRLYRCSSDDKIWLSNLAQYVVVTQGNVSTQSIDSPAPASNDVFVDVSTGELTIYPLKHSPEYWVKKYTKYPPFFWADFSPELTVFAEEMQNYRYHEPLQFTYANMSKHTKPVLTMQGTLDPQTPFYFAEDWNKHYNRSNNYFVAFPNAVHGTAFSTPIKHNATYVNDLCGSVILLDFVYDNSRIRNSCVPHILDYTFDFDYLSPSVAVVTDGLPLWDNSVSSSSSGDGSGNAASKSDAKLAQNSGSMLQMSWTIIILGLLLAIFLAFK